MKCKLFKIYSGLFFSLLFSCFFFSFNCFALDDITKSYTVNDGSLTSTTPLGLMGQNCSDFNSSDHVYLIINSSFVPYEVNTQLSLYLYSNNNLIRVNIYPFTSPYILYDLSNYDVWDGDYCLRLYNTFYIRDNISFTLSDHLPSSSLTPSGSISITENGTYDVSNYAEAVVDVPESSGSGGDYHNDLVAINNSILICAATCLVIYFFYCIYRMIIKSTGGF